MIELKTSKGEFVVTESNELLVTKNTVKMFDFQTSIHVINGVKYECISKLSEATDDDAKLIVDEHNHYFNDGTISYYFRDYRVESEYDEPSRLPFAIDSLKTLLKSKGIDVNNSNLYLFKKT